MEKCQSQNYQQLSFTFFEQLFSMPKLMSKVSDIQTTISGGTHKHEWVNVDICTYCLIITPPPPPFSCVSLSRHYKEAFFKHEYVNVDICTYSMIITVPLSCACVWAPRGAGILRPRSAPPGSQPGRPCSYW